MKRQIIKTKPVQPYRVARIVIVAIVLIIALALGYFGYVRTHAHADANDRTAGLVVFVMKPQSPAVLS